MSAREPIGAERVPCRCTTLISWGPWFFDDTCTDCCGLGYHDDPIFEGDITSDTDQMRHELDPTYPMR